MKVLTPIQTVFLHLTKACNLRCKYCYFSARQALPDEFSTLELRRLWPDLITLGPEKVVFTGGEPLLRGDLLEVLRSLRHCDSEHRVLRCLNTNGHLLTPELAQSLVGLVDEMRVSIDALRQRNDQLRGEGNFAAAMAAIDTLRAVGFEPKVLVTLTSVSLPDLESLVQLLLEKRITRIKVNAFRPIGRGVGLDSLSAPLDEARAAVRRALRSASSDCSDPFAGQEGQASQSHCGVGKFVNVTPTGDVFPCHVLTQPEFRCGSLREESLLEICRRSGLLGSLAHLDFELLGQVEPEFMETTKCDACFGEIYSRASCRSQQVVRESAKL